jgi:hypothetical protein
MTDGPERVVFQMEVDRDAEPISGVLRRDGSEFSFDGWLGLAGALERILEAPGHDLAEGQVREVGDSAK